MDLLSRQVDAKRVVLEKPVLTFRLGKDDRREAQHKKRDAVKAAGEKPRRDMKLKDVRIEDGTVNIIYDDRAPRSASSISPQISACRHSPRPSPARQARLERADGRFQFRADLSCRSPREAPSQAVLGIDTPAIAVRFDGSLLTKPDFTRQGELSAKAHSIPSLLAWMQEKPTASAAIGDGELASHVAWTKDEITLSGARFALEHASGQGQAVVTLRSPRPHVRAALALDYLDLNPFFPAGRAKAAGTGGKPKAAQPDAAPRAETAVPRQSPAGEGPPAATGQDQDLFGKSDDGQSAGGDETKPEQSSAEAAQPAPDQAPVAAGPAPVASPASFDADVNLNIRKTRVAHLEIGPSSLGLAFRDGILNATLGGMELYDGHASGKLVLDAAKPVPSFTGDFQLDGVQAKPLCRCGADQPARRSHQAHAPDQRRRLQRRGDQVLADGTRQLAVSDGAIEGVDITEMISQLGAGEIPNLRQGPGAKTAFNDLGGTFTITNGIAQTDNLQITSPLLKVAASGTVDLTQSTIDMVANPEIVAGPSGQGGANDLAGLSVPVRIQGPLDRPTIKPELKGISAEQAGKAVNKIGEALQKKFKGKPMGEAIGRFLGKVQIGPHGDDDGAAEPRSNRKRSKKDDQIRLRAPTTASKATTPSPRIPTSTASCADGSQGLAGACPAPPAHRRTPVSSVTAFTARRQRIDGDRSLVGFCRSCLSRLRPPTPRCSLAAFFN